MRASYKYQSLWSEKPERIQIQTNGTHICLDVANPLDSVKALIGLHIVSFATFMNLSTKQVRISIISRATNAPKGNVGMNEEMRTKGER